MGCQYIKCIFRGKIKKDCGLQTQEHDPEVSGAFAEKNFRPARRKNGKRRDPVFRRSTRKVPSFSSRHFFISFPASRFFLYLQQIFNALLGLFLLKKFF